MNDRGVSCAPAFSIGRFIYLAARLPSTPQEWERVHYAETMALLVAIRRLGGERAAHFKSWVFSPFVPIKFLGLEEDIECRARRYIYEIRVLQKWPSDRHPWRELWT